MATFTWTPTNGARQQTSPRVRRVRFGDGYEQRQPDGINTKGETWSLAFAGLTDAEADEIDTFLAARNAVEAFDWVTPAGDAIKAVCDDWGRDFAQYDMNTISATFRRVYEP